MLNVQTIELNMYKRGTFKCEDPNSSKITTVGVLWLAALCDYLVFCVFVFLISESRMQCQDGCLGSSSRDGIMLPLKKF